MARAAKPRPIFAPVGEVPITRAIIRGFLKDFEKSVDCDVLIVGAGPSGLVAGMDLARAGYNVAIVEEANFLGGGFWMGGYQMNKVTVRKPGHLLLEEIGCPYEEVEAGLCLIDAAHACSKLIAAAFDAGVRFIQMTRATDLVLRNGRVEGLVINYASVYALPKGLGHVDPIALQSRIVIDATGHDAAMVVKLRKRTGEQPIPGNGAMWIESSEDLVVQNTRFVYPGLMIAGLAVAAVDGSPRMGPTFGAMFLSGRRAAELAIDELRGKRRAKAPGKKNPPRRPAR
ncbi:MAG TPA: sulfide-dependent adenosine diphosphate thiazole synthase [Thermoanaerobaculia bacterium]|nr:sulfide-dependent adenosine diphosphate thiazole synthase [Thermoanaerobaculia bacterium]